jgi:predicted amidophosphoribosyltransferase
MPLIDALIEIGAHMLWPVSCPVCGAVGEILCEPCLRSLFRPPLPRCLLCGEVIPCKIHKGDTAKIRAGAAYEGDMRELVLTLKKGKYEALGFCLGRGLASAFARPGLDLLVPVPLHLKSRRRYNQTAAIARGMGEVWNIETRDAARWTADVTTRAGLSAAERLSLSSEVFEFEDIAGLRIGLVDDVCTTGSTLSRLATAARERGAEVAGAFVLAGSAFVR